MSNTEPQTINKAIWISYKGSPETPLHFISRYKGDSVGRYRRYPCEWESALRFKRCGLHDLELLIQLHGSSQS